MGKKERELKDMCRIIGSFRTEAYFLNTFTSMHTKFYGLLWIVMKVLNTDTCLRLSEFVTLILFFFSCISHFRWNNSCEEYKNRWIDKERRWWTGLWPSDVPSLKSALFLNRNLVCGISQDWTGIRFRCWFVLKNPMSSVLFNFWAWANKII